MKKYFLLGAVCLTIMAFAAISLPKLNKDTYELFGYVKDDISISIPARLSADLEGDSVSYEKTENVYTSEIKYTSFPFSGLGMSWNQRTPKNSSVDMEVRFYTNDKWTTWEHIKIDDDTPEQMPQPTTDETFQTFSSFITTNPSKAFQYRYTLYLGDNASPEVKDINFTYINANDDPVRKEPSVLSSLMYNPGSLIASTHFSQNGIRYVARNQWGANEDLRIYKKDNTEPKLIQLPPDFYIRFAQELKLHKIVEKNSKSEKLTWPLQYPEKISKIIIHHTASTKDLDDPEKAIRDIYYYHAIARGWGDIGYNYIIDTKGNIYEGRFGGEGVVGAHAGPGNRGSIGIALIGNFNDDEVTPEALHALETLISDKTKLHNIDPEGESYFRGEKMPNIFGHGDIMPTSCPGKNLNELIPQIRKDVAKLNGSIKYQNTPLNKNAEYAFEYIPTLAEIIMPPDRNMQYTVKIKNVGTKTWTKDTRLSLESDILIDKGFSISVSGMQEAIVSPGQTATFNIKIYSKLYGGFYYLSFKPLINGSETDAGTFSIPTIVEKPFFAYQLVNISIPKSNLKTESQTVGVVTLKNNGNVKWRNYGENRISLGTENPRDRLSAFTKSTRMGYLKESIVNPGEVGHFIFNLKAPKTAGKYEEFFAPVIERVTWLEGNEMKLELDVS